MGKKRVGFGGIALIVEIPFTAGAVLLIWRLSHLPNDVGVPETLPLLRGILFALGFATGLHGAVSALAAYTPSRKLTETAITLFGSGNIAAAFTFGAYAGWTIQPLLTPLIAPATFWILSIVLFLSAARLKKPEAAAKKSEVSEELPLPLSRP